MAAHAARIGPNAIIQVGAALRALAPAVPGADVFAAAGLAAAWDAPPREMVAESDVARLHAALFRLLPADAARVAADAGRRTADYIIANRIPAPARLLLQASPRALAAPLLLAAIARNAWTFAGSGRVRVARGSPCSIEIAANPIAQPGCPWHVAVFERLFARLVARGTRVRETACCARGAPACRFEIDPG